MQFFSEKGDFTNKKRPKRPKKWFRSLKRPGHGPGNLRGNLQAVKGNLENLRKIDAELRAERQNVVKMVEKHHFCVVLT